MSITLYCLNKLAPALSLSSQQERKGISSNVSGLEQIYWLDGNFTPFYILML